MDFQEKTATLWKYHDALKAAEYYKREIEQYKATMEQAKVQQITGMPFVGGNGSDLSDYIVKLEEMNGEMYGHLIRAQQMKTNIMVWIEKLPDVTERLVLQYHFLQNHTLGWIADELHFSERTVKRKKNRAVDHLPDPDFELWI